MASSIFFPVSSSFIARSCSALHSSYIPVSHDHHMIQALSSHDLDTVSCDFTCSKLLVTVLNHAQMTRNLYAINQDASKSMTCVHVCTEAQSMLCVSTQLLPCSAPCGVVGSLWSVDASVWWTSARQHTQLVWNCTPITYSVLSHQWQQKTFGGTWQTPLPFLPHSYGNHEGVKLIIPLTPMILWALPS